MRNVSATTDSSRRKSWFAKEWLAYKGLRQTDVVSRTTLTKSLVSEYVGGSRRWNEDVLEDFARVLGIEPADLLRAPYESESKLAMLGYIGAGDRVFHFGIGETRITVDAPPGITRGIAAEVRGHSMAPVYRDRDLVFATEHFGKVSELIGLDCFVQVHDGPLYLKVLRKGTKDTFTLESYNGVAPIQDQIIEWAAPVTWVKRSL